MTDDIPSTAIIISATLKLFGTDLRQDYSYAFSYFSTSPYINNASIYDGPNRVNIYRATSLYLMSTVT